MEVITMSDHEKDAELNAAQQDVNQKQQEVEQARQRDNPSLIDRYGNVPDVDLSSKENQLNQAKQQEAEKTTEVNQDNNITKDFSKDNEKTLAEIKDSFKEQDVDHTEIAPEQAKQDVDNIRDIDLGNANEAFKNKEIEHNEQILTKPGGDFVPLDKPYYGDSLVEKYGQAPTKEADKSKDIEKDEPDK